MENTINRIREMERIFDALLMTAKQNPEKFRTDSETVQNMNALIRYYEGDEWRADYEADEKGLIPKTLKRGVLSEDGIYDLICDYEAILGK